MYIKIVQIKYSDLNIGKDAAEQEDIDALKSYFFETPEFSNVLSHERHFLLGNRGTGKSALLRMVQDRAEPGTTIYITPERYSYSVLKELLDQRPNAKWGQEASFASAWKFTILILILKEIENTTKGTIARGHRKTIHDYLKSNHANVSFDGITLMYQFLERLQSAKVAGFEIALQKAVSLQRLYKLEELEIVRPALLGIFAVEPFTILVDELDTGWDGSEAAQYFIAGLFAAAQDLNSMHQNLNVVVALRRDIFEGVPSIYSDQEKIRDQIIDLRWNQENLLSMAANRIASAFSSHGVQISLAEAWHQIFSEDLEFRNAKSGTYIVERTLYRPRDIIQFLKFILRSTGKLYPEKLNYDDVVEGEKKFSEAKIKDLSAEYQYLYPGLLKLFEVFRGQTYLLEKEELETILLEFTCGSVAQECGSWAKEIDPKNLAKILYEVGFLRAYLAGAQTGGRKHGSGYYGSYELQFRPNLDEVSRFQISWVFRQYLRLKEKK